ncbi:MAG: hypothetical protein KAS17_12450 [Victivallaceae bacterium]|nr:hypothetical protein [Victivallaceae bacterium]
MIADNVHDALAQIKQLQGFILGKKYFSGYSWQTKIIGGCIVLLGALIMASSYCPKTIQAHLIGWTVIIFTAMLINYAGLFYWFFFNKTIKRQWVRLLPAIDMLPEVTVGIIFSAAMIQHQQYDMLMGVWLCIYGLVHVSYRQTLPKGNYIVGIYYIICGALFLFLNVRFINSVPLGIIICTGETTCGLTLYKNRR